MKLPKLTQGLLLSAAILASMSVSAGIFSTRSSWERLKVSAVSKCEGVVLERLFSNPDRIISPDELSPEERRDPEIINFLKNAKTDPITGGLYTLSAENGGRSERNRFAWTHLRVHFMAYGPPKGNQINYPVESVFYRSNGSLGVIQSVTSFARRNIFGGIECIPL